MEDPDKVDQEGLPYPKFELMHEINYESSEDIKVEFLKSIRKCILERT